MKPSKSSTRLLRGIKDARDGLSLVRIKALNNHIHKLQHTLDKYLPSGVLSATYIQRFNNKKYQIEDQICVTRKLLETETYELENTIISFLCSNFPQSAMTVQTSITDSYILFDVHKDEEYYKLYLKIDMYYSKIEDMIELQTI